MIRTVLLAILFLTLIPRASVAHPLDICYNTVDVRKEQMTVTLEMNPKAAAEFIKTGGRGGLMEATLGSSRVSLNEHACRWGPSHIEHINESLIRLSSEATCPEAGTFLDIDLSFLKRASPTYQVLGRIRLGDIERTVLAEPTHSALKLTVRHDKNLLEFVGMGIRHIGAAPSEWKDSKGIHFPDGIDHILFLFGLILGGGAGGGLWRTLKTATGFTLGHSVTLALAASGWVRPPGRIVESAIALSIAYIALEVLILKAPRRRFEIATFFGLVHGFGFASALQELQLKPKGMLEALVGFNFGVEVGQALIVLALVPLVIVMHSQPRLAKYGVPGFAAAIALIGSYWFVQRATG